MPSDHTDDLRAVPERHREEGLLDHRRALDPVAVLVVCGIADDDRLRGILEGLTIQFKLTPQNIALLTHTNVGDVEACLADPGTVSPEVKFPLAVRASYLNLAIANARRH